MGVNVCLCLRLFLKPGPAISFRIVRSSYHRMLSQQFRPWRYSCSSRRLLSTTRRPQKGGAQIVASMIANRSSIMRLNHASPVRLLPMVNSAVELLGIE